MNLVVTAAGAGTRFLRAGVAEPKPLVLFRDRPLFWWAAESALASGAFDSLHFAVLRAHANDHGVDREIRRHYPSATVHWIERLTAGAAATAGLVAERLEPDTGVAFLDCDLAFDFSEADAFAPLQRGAADAAICLFRSTNPAYSYARLDSAGNVAGTVEKQAVSSWAIAGLYAFRQASCFLDSLAAYAANCQYEELFMSGVLNQLLADGGTVHSIALASHLSLGTPAELHRAMADTQSLPKWFPSA